MCIVLKISRIVNPFAMPGSTIIIFSLCRWTVSMVLSILDGCLHRSRTHVILSESRLAVPSQFAVSRTHVILSESRLVVRLHFVVAPHTVHPQWMLCSGVLRSLPVACVSTPSFRVLGHFCVETTMSATFPSAALSRPSWQNADIREPEPWVW